MLSIITKANFLPLLVPSIPGMIYTLFTAYPITKIFEKLVKKEGIKNK